MKYFPILFFHVIVLLNFPARSIAQNLESDTLKTAKNSVYVELWGHSSLYSLNYERQLFSLRKFKVAGRIGISYFPNLNNKLSSKEIFAYPSEIILFYGKTNNIELSFGCTPVFKLYSDDLSKVYDSYVISGIRIGYRFQPLQGGYFFRADIDPIVFLPKYVKIGDNISDFLILGICMGYTFK